MFLGKGQVWLISVELDITVLRPGGELLIVSHGDGEEPKHLIRVYLALSGCGSNLIMHPWVQLSQTC